MNSTKILIVAKYFYDDSMLKALIRHLKKLSQLDTFFLKNNERPRSLKNSINLRFKKKIQKEKYDIVIIWNNILLDEELDLINKNTITFGILNGFSGMYIDT